MVGIRKRSNELVEEAITGCFIGHEGERFLELVRDQKNPLARIASAALRDDIGQRDL